jgi:nitrogen fixation protein FixH
MNWGWKLFLAFFVFVGFILFMVFSAIRQDFHLVVDNYYEKEIKYQGEIDMIRNARALEEQIVIEYKPASQSVHLSYPGAHLDAIKGKIYFFRPADSGDDREFIITPDKKGKQVISVKSLKKGLWQVKINWRYGATEYQEEKNLILQ